MNPRQERDKARDIFEDLVRLALSHLDEHQRTSLIAAGSSWAKWSAACAIAELIEAKKLAKTTEPV